MTSMLKFALSLLACLAPQPLLAGLKVVTDIPPVQSLVAGVMGETGAPVLLLRPGTSPHDLALRPSDATALEAADVVFWIGPSLSPMLEKAMTTLGADARRVLLLEAPGTNRLALREGADLGDHAHEDGHEGRETEGPDPHAWLDPSNGIAWARVIAETLAEADPENAALYRANAAATAARITVASAEAQALLSAHRPSFALYHDELNYFSHAFGVTAVTALTDSDAQSPGPRRRTEVLDLLAQSRPACIVGSPEIAPAALTPLSAAAGAKVVTLDTLTAGQAPGPDLYPGLFTTLAAALASCQR